MLIESPGGRNQQSVSEAIRALQHKVEKLEAEKQTLQKSVSLSSVNQLRAEGRKNGGAEVNGEERVMVQVV